MMYDDAQRIAKVVRDAGGKVVGRTRLQKLVYLLSYAGFEPSLSSFAYKHYGPYSETVAGAARNADLLGLLIEKEQQASWGGSFSIYTTAGASDEPSDSARVRLATEAASADAVELELAATALYLATKGFSDPWVETARRKPEKAADGRLDKAKALYRRLSRIAIGKDWPGIA